MSQNVPRRHGTSQEHNIAWSAITQVSSGNKEKLNDKQNNEQFLRRWEEFSNEKESGIIIYALDV